MPFEGNWDDGVIHPSNRDVEQLSPFQPLGWLPVDCSSVGDDSDSDTMTIIPFFPGVPLFHRAEKQGEKQQG